MYRLSSPLRAELSTGRVVRESSAMVFQHYCRSSGGGGGVCNITPASYCLSVLPWQVSVCLSSSHTFLVVTHSHVSQATHAFLGLLPLCFSYEINFFWHIMRRYSEQASAHISHENCLIEKWMAEFFYGL